MAEARCSSSPQESSPSPRPSASPPTTSSLAPTRRSGSTVGIYIVGTYNGGIYIVAIYIVGNYIITIYVFGIYQPDGAVHTIQQRHQVLLRASNLKVNPFGIKMG